MDKLTEADRRALKATAVGLAAMAQCLFQDLAQEHQQVKVQRTEPTRPALPDQFNPIALLMGFLDD
jgi:hypothetical protein